MRLSAGMRSDPKVAALRQLDLLDGLSNRDLRQVARLTTDVVIPAGQRLMRQGDVGREAFVLLEGHATVSRDGQPIAEVGPGDVVGELALLDRHERSATVTATTDIAALVLDPREFATLLEHRRIADRLRRIAADRQAA